MAETTVIIEGGATNKSFVLDLLDQPEVIDAQRGHRLDRPGPRRGPAGRAPALRRRARRRGDRGLRGRGGGRAAAAARHRARRPPAGPARRAAAPLDLKLRGVGYRVRVARTGPQPVPGRRSAAAATRAPGRRRGRAVRRAQRPAHRQRRSASGWSPARTARSTWSRSTASPTGSAATRAASSARPRPRWWSRPRSPSATRSTAGAPILVLESMKMETVLRAPFRGPGARAAGLGRQPGRDRRAAAAPRAARRRGRRRRTAGRRRGRRDRPARRAGRRVGRRARAERGLRDLRSLLLGFDVDPRRPAPHAGRLPGRARRAGRGRPSAARRGRAAHRVRRPVRAEPQPAGRRGHAAPSSAVHSPREYFHTYLQSLDVERAGLPETFQARLRPRARPLRRHRAWTARRELEEAVFRIFLAQQRAARRRRDRLGAAAAVADRARRPPSRCASEPAWRWSTSSRPPRCASRP